MAGWRVEAANEDCLGNPGVYCVRRYLSGAAMDYVEAEAFVGNIYKDGSHERAKADAEALRDLLNEDDSEFFEDYYKRIAAIHGDEEALIMRCRVESAS